MILTYPGGVSLPPRAEGLKTELTLSSVGRVFLPLGSEEEAYTITVCEGENVLAGAKIAMQGDETPVYSSVAGKVVGVFERGGVHYIAVDEDPELKKDVRTVREPESRALSELTGEELLDAVKLLGVADTYSGDYLWRRLSRAIGKTRRVVVDVTDDAGWSFTEYRTALKHPGEVLGGAKVLLHLLGATRIILLTDSMRKKTFEAFRTMINDPKLVILAEIEAKYPLRDETLYEAIYVRRLPKGKSAQDEGIFIVKAQTAVALYQAILTGKPQTIQTLTAAGEGFGRNAVLNVPMGTAWRTILDGAKFKGGEYQTSVGSLLCGEKAEGALDMKTEAVFADLPVRREEAHCIACGRCAEVCPMRLEPFRILGTRNVRTAKHLSNVCIGCGCCDYICPSQISLKEKIGKGAQGASAK